MMANGYQDTPDYMPFTALNPAADHKNIIYIGAAPTTLEVAIVNNTGSDIKLQPGQGGSSMEIYMPSYFSAAEVQAITITALSQSGWTAQYSASDVSIILSYGGTATPWANGATLKFTMGNVVTAATTPTVDTLQVNLTLVGQNIPASVSEQLLLNQQDVPTNQDLTQVLQLSLDNQGSVFISVQADPLNNTIYLNFKNIGNTPLYNDTKQWPGNPVVTVGFIYGNTVGALAPDTGISDSSLGSAWYISASVVTNQGWGYNNPTDNGQKNGPTWELFPTPSNLPIIGTGADANVTFAFSNVASFTPAGHTQMYVQFAGFNANFSTPYNTAVFTLDINKQNPPPTRGLLSFFGTNGSIIPITSPQNNIEIPLRWSMYYVDNINLICNIPGAQLWKKNYYSAGMPALGYDSYSLTVPVNISQDTPVFITLQAFDNEGGYLNSMQFTAFISASFFADPNGQVYPVVFLNSQNWLAGNYNYNVQGALSYQNNGGYRPTYGMLYNQATAQQIVPPGWRLPTQQDWQNLFNAIGSTAFQALMTGGTTGFNATLGGFEDNLGSFYGMESQGEYWTSTPDNTTPGNYIRAQFYSLGGNTGSVNVTGSYLSAYFLSVRFVQNS